LVDFDELAELREEAARLCEETVTLVEEHKRLRKWADEFRHQAMPLEALPPALAVSDAVPPRPATPAHPQVRVSNLVNFRRGR